MAEPILYLIAWVESPASVAFEPIDPVVYFFDRVKVAPIYLESAASGPITKPVEALDS